MKEKSQLDAMRAALRGDLERARERRGATLLDPEPESAAEPEPEAEVPDIPDEAPELVVQVPQTPEPEPEAEPEPEPEPTPRRRFLWFLRD
jgi:hypothetical protein